ncbi:MAG: hypothetical protein VXX85_06605, partial [Candidatus Margulisiibacteriota bacterium]|nr:hypothetical protein [Candidatus Margulisiibacteriota bacterium]
MRYKSLLFISTLIIIALSVTVPIELSVNFKAKEAWIPKDDISQAINKHQHIRLFQMVYWPVIKTELEQAFPMVDGVFLTFSTFPKIKVNITEKTPWALIMVDNKTLLFANDGTLLNKGLLDFEVPETPILIASSDRDVFQNNQMDVFYLSALSSIAKNLENIPFFKINQIFFKKQSVYLMSNTGIRVDLGYPKEINEKFRKLKYFIGQNRQNLNRIELID